MRYEPIVSERTHDWTYDERDAEGRLAAFVRVRVPAGEPRPEHLTDVPQHWPRLRRREAFQLDRWAAQVDAAPAAPPISRAHPSTPDRLLPGGRCA